MEVLFNDLLPRLFPNIPFLCVPHEGKQDLAKSIPRKLRSWNEPGVKFAIVRDQATTCQRSAPRERRQSRTVLAWPIFPSATRAHVHARGGWRRFAPVS